jgi:hypothetical protein
MADPRSGRHRPPDGLEPRDFARDLIAREGGPEAAVKPLTPQTDRPGPYKGTGNANPWGARYADLLTRIMGADMAAIPAEYDRAAQLELPGARHRPRPPRRRPLLDGPPRGLPLRDLHHPPHHRARGPH